MMALRMGQASVASAVLPLPLHTSTSHLLMSPLMQGLSDALKNAGRDLSAAHSAAAAKTGALQADLDAANAAVISLKVLSNTIWCHSKRSNSSCGLGCGVQSASKEQLRRASGGSMTCV